MRTKLCDLVMEGGGVKGIGLAGAAATLQAHGYQFRRLAGTSSGAIIGSLLAAGYTGEELRSVLLAIDYTKFQDESLLDHFGWVGKGLSLLFEKGIYEGNYIRQLLYDQLAKKGVRTFGDLRIAEQWCQDAPPEERYKVVVLTADVSRGRLVRLPWDYADYGLNPDDQLVADAVRASISIPFFYEPARLRGNYMVDGGMLSNFPIDIFDTTPDWPTFGVKLSSREDANLHFNPISGPISFAQAVMNTTLNAQDQRHLNNPETVARTIFIDSLGIKPADFAITRTKQQLLYEQGRRAAQKFLRKKLPLLQ